MSSKITNSIPEAVRHKLTPTPYSYEGQIERLEERIKLQEELIGNLIDELYGRALKADVIARLVSSYNMDWEPEE